MSSKDSLQQQGNFMSSGLSHSLSETSTSNSKGSTNQSPTKSLLSNKQVIPNLKTEVVPRQQFSKKALVRTDDLYQPSKLLSLQYTHPYFSLPEPVRVKILKYLTHTERLLLQFVCRRFRNDIRLRAGLRTKITDETAQGITFLRDVLVTSIVVGKFDRPIYPPTKLIYNPDHITELIFEEPICVQHLDAFLSRCRKLKWLIIRTTVIDATVNPLTVKSQLTGSEWRNLELIHKFPIAQIFLKQMILSIPGPGLKTVNRCLAILNTPNLERFSLVVKESLSFEDTTGIHFAVLNFLKNCISALSHVLIDTLQRPGTIKYARSGSSQSLKRELNQQYVEKLQIKQIVLTESAVNFETWNMILNHQSNLEIWQVLHMTIWSLLRDIVIINSKTLVKVALHTILWDKHGKHNPVDLSVFNRAINLKELYICVAPPAAEGLVDFINFQKLPKNLEVLALKHCHVNVKDFLSVRNLVHLKSLGIVSVRNVDGGNYIGMKTLRKLMHIRRLDELLVNGLMAEGKEAEDLKMSLINRMKARVKDKRKAKNTFHCFATINRWTMNKQGGFMFTLTTNWGFLTS